MSKHSWWVRGLVLAVVLLLFPGFAAGAEKVSYRTTGVTTVTAPQTQAVSLGMLVVEFSPLQEGEHHAIVALPQGYTAVVEGPVRATENPHVSMDITVTGQKNEFGLRIVYTGDPRELTFSVPVSVMVPSGAKGDITLKVNAIDGQFTNDELLIGRIAGGEVNLSSTPTVVRAITPGLEIPFRLEVAESKKATLRAGSGTLRFDLPEGFSWGAAEAEVVLDGGYEPTARVDEDNPGQLYVDIRETAVRNKGSFALSGFVAAHRTLLEGDVKVRVSGIDLPRDVTLVLARATAPEIEARFFVGRDLYIVNGTSLTLDVVPYIKEGRLFLPLRYVGLSLGVEPDDIKWDGAVATLTGHGKTIKTRPGTKQLIVNGTTVEMDVASQLVQGRVMLPYRFIAEAFGADVDWDPEDRTVSITI